MSETTPSPPKKKSPIPVILVITACIIGILCVGGYLVKDTVGHAKSQMGEMLTVRTLTTSFYKSAAQYQDTQRLQMQTVSANEIITQKDSAEIFNITLPDVIVEARVPVEYTYFVDLKGAWNFLIDEATNQIQVNCPDIGFNTPAVAFNLSLIHI